MGYQKGQCPPTALNVSSQVQLPNQTKNGALLEIDVLLEDLIAAPSAPSWVYLRPLESFEVIRQG